MPPLATADTLCHERGKLTTPAGLLKQIHCEDKGQRGIDRWALDGRVLVEGEYPINSESSEAGNRFLVLSSASSRSTHCSENLFLLDLSDTRPRVFRFGVRNACNEYHWASWGKQRSVIAIKNNVRFVYANGRLTPPKHDAALMEKLQFSAYGGSNVFEEVVPFAEEIMPAVAAAPGR